MNTRTVVFSAVGLGLLTALIFARRHSVSAETVQQLLILLETPAENMNSNHLQADQQLAGLMMSPTNRTSSVKKRLFALANRPKYSMHDPAFNSLMYFKGDQDVRRLFIDTLHNHPLDTTRGIMTGRLLINTDHDKAVLPELQKALSDPSEFVRVRAAEDLGREGDFSGVPLIVEILRVTPATRQEDIRIGTAARAAGSIRHKDFLAPLKRLVALGKSAPRSSNEALSSLRLTELQLETNYDAKLMYVRNIAGSTNGISWIGRELIWYLDHLHIKRKDVRGILAEYAKSSDTFVANSADEAIREIDAPDPR